MIEHHFVVVYNRDTGHFYMDNEMGGVFPSGPIYDTTTGNFRPLDNDDFAEDEAACGWLSAALNKLSDETTKVGHL